MDRFLKDMFRTAVSAVLPSAFMPRLISQIDLSGPFVVAGAGKAAPGMAEAAEALLDVRGGVVVTRYGQAAKCHCRKITVLEASHPIPDEAGARAAARILRVARDCGKDQTLLCLLSGGGSALMSLPVEGVTRQEMGALVADMLAAGVPIQDLNCVRRHLSAINGGRLAVAASPANVLTIAVSDVVGDDPASIASGPTVPDRTTLADARAVISGYRIRVSPSVAAALADPRNETPFPGDPLFERCRFHMAACGNDALDAAAGMAVSEGWDVMNLGAAVTGDSRAAAAAHAGIVRQLRAAGRRCVILSGGETTTVLRGPGRGGSNTEFLLALAMELKGMDDVWALAADTDGVDGSGDQAGAWFGPRIMQALDAMGDVPRMYLDASDSASILESLGALVRTGPTGTNVNDFRAIVVR